MDADFWSTEGTRQTSRKSLPRYRKCPAGRGKFRSLILLGILLFFDLAKFGRKHQAIHKHNPMNLRSIAKRRNQIVFDLLHHIRGSLQKSHVCHDEGPKFPTRIDILRG